MGASRIGFEVHRFGGSPRWRRTLRVSVNCWSVWGSGGPRRRRCGQRAADGARSDEAPAQLVGLGGHRPGLVTSMRLRSMDSLASSRRPSRYSRPISAESCSTSWRNSSRRASRWRRRTSRSSASARGAVSSPREATAARTRSGLTRSKRTSCTSKPYRRPTPSHRPHPWILLSPASVVVEAGKPTLARPLRRRAMPDHTAAHSGF